MVLVVEIESQCFGRGHGAKSPEELLQRLRAMDALQSPAAANTDEVLIQQLYALVFAALETQITATGHVVFKGAVTVPGRAPSFKGPSRRVRWWVALEKGEMHKAAN